MKAIQASGNAMHEALKICGQAGYRRGSPAMFKHLGFVSSPVLTCCHPGSLAEVLHRWRDDDNGQYHSYLALPTVAVRITLNTIQPV